MPTDLDHPVRRALDEVLDALALPRRQVQATAAAFAARAPRRRADLRALEPHLRSALDALPAGVDGTGVVVAEDLLEDAPLHLEWWRRGAGGATERLEVSFDEEDPARFNYPEAEWFAVPRDQGTPWIAGPFVDSGGTNRHLCTYSVPVRSPAGAFLGIAGADLRVGHLERTARRALATVPEPAALVNRDGRVIASSDPGIAAGTLLDAAGLPGGGVWDPVLPWGLVLLPAA
jgi:hypothetical protein